LFDYIVHLEDHNFKTSSPFLEKETPISSYITQVHKSLSLLPFIKSDDPIASLSFESLIEQKFQIPIIPKHSQPCEIFEKEVHIPSLEVTSIPSNHHVQIHP